MRLAARFAPRCSDLIPQSRGWHRSGAVSFAGQ